MKPVLIFKLTYYRRLITDHCSKMGNPLFREFERLVKITVLGKEFPVPEKNTCLRAFQYMSPETIPYGRFCWNQECQLCRVTYTMAGQPDGPPRAVLACKILVADGMQITELSDELRYNLMGVICPSPPRPSYDDDEAGIDPDLPR